MSELDAFTQKFRDFVFYPVTVWSDFWRDFFHPSIYLGCNIKDENTEKAVLDEVGSYGYQLNRILNALAVVLDTQFAHLDGLTREQQNAVVALRVLHAEADTAARKAQGEPLGRTPPQTPRDARGAHLEIGDLEALGWPGTR